MILLVGGSFQGKRAYAEAHYVASQEDWRDGETLCTAELATARAIDHLHLYIRRSLAEGKTEEELLSRLGQLREDAVVLCDEVGSGIVPIDAFERQYRDTVGRCCQMLAARAEEVYRLVFGIATRLKGAPRAELLLIRHGQTDGNRQRRYLGRTDEPLLPASKKALQTVRVPEVARVYCSPMLRCRQTAAALYPTHLPVFLDDLRECDFGRFEGKTHEEMLGDSDYQDYLNSGATLPFPEGESREAFRDRVVAALHDILDDMQAKKIDRAAVVTHGGVIMALLAACERQKKGFYDWFIPNAKGYLCRTDPLVRPALLEVVDDADLADKFPLLQWDRSAV